MEKGFYHPSRGYWQTTSEPPERIRAKYPEGTIEAPLKPGPDYEFDGSNWQYVAPPAPTPEETVLAPYQFHAMLEIAGLDQTVRQEIDGMADGRDKAAARAKFERANNFYRTDPLVSALATQVGLTEEQIDTMWMEAAAL
jgi:hypothetical protein